ncbi:Protein of unknown function DUF2370 containing protein [Cricetulus griseus]|nr:Protein of unknown function DUF2370 containing protein [Cricetulus griseus]
MGIKEPPYGVCFHYGKFYYVKVKTFHFHLDYIHKYQVIRHGKKVIRMSLLQMTRKHHDFMWMKKLHNEEDHSESSAVEQPSTSNSTAHAVGAAPSAPALETDSAPPPYSSITVEVPTTSDAEVYSEFYPVPPPYSVATSLPTYDEAEKAKAAAMAAAAAETPQRNQEEECTPRDDFSDVDQLRVGNDGIFMLAFFTGRYGAICGFGLSLIKWILIVRFSDYFTGYFNGQYWLWWIFLVLGLLLFFRGFVNYLKVRNMSESMAAAHRTRYFFLL